MLNPSQESTEEMGGIQLRVRKVSQHQSERDMIVFVRLFESAKHIALLSHLDGMRLDQFENTQIHAINGRCTNFEYNDEHRYKGDVYMFEYVRIPFLKQSGSYEWQSYTFGLDVYDEQDAAEASASCKYRVTQFTQHLQRNSHEQRTPLSRANDPTSQQDKPQDESDDDSFYTAIDSQSDSDNESTVTIVCAQPTIKPKAKIQ